MTIRIPTLATRTAARDNALIAAYQEGTNAQEIAETWMISKATLYAVLRKHKIPLRCPPPTTITVLDPDTHAPIEVDRTEETIALQAKQIASAYNSGQLISVIIHLFGISYRRLYSVCEPNRYAR